MPANEETLSGYRGMLLEMDATTRALLNADKILVAGSDLANKIQGLLDERRTQRATQTLALSEFKTIVANTLSAYAPRATFVTDFCCGTQSFVAWLDFGSGYKEEIEAYPSTHESDVRNKVWAACRRAAMRLLAGGQP